MLPANTRWRKLASATVNFWSKARFSSFSHLTPWEIRRYWEYMESKSRLPPEPIPQAPLPEQVLRPQFYRASSSSWVALKDDRQMCLPRGSTLKVVSWNINALNPGESARAFAALDHLQELFGTVPGQLVVMLQEVCNESLQAILESPWIQQNFILNNVNAPESIYRRTLGSSFIMIEPSWAAHRYFTIMMIPRYLESVHCFRAPFTTEMGRDVLCVDVPISTSDGSTRSNDSLRLCTTHLESLWHGKAYRSGQLAMISRLLKRPQASKTNIIGGFVGGDMNALDRSEHEMHRTSDIGLKDVWEDAPAPLVPLLKPFQKDMSFGRARGNTWGYQSGARTRKRMDKFFYSGLVEAVALTEPQDATGKLGRIGIGLETEIEAWQTETTEGKFVRGKFVEKLCKQYYSDRQARSLMESG
ncbi:hypothetical protein PMIN04_012302, partial [Paraphaeosphaeria minitans]